MWDSRIMLTFTQIKLDCPNSPADVNPKGTSAAAERKKRTSVKAAMPYGYCSLYTLTPPQRKLISLSQNAIFNLKLLKIFIIYTSQFQFYNV